MELTDYHAKYLAHELTRRCASDSVEKLASVLADAQVDLNPHQVDAALFAFRSPFAKGAILADEVGLGKTIEAGLLLAQKWAERKRHLLVIVPANLRKQWSQELEDKFYLPSLILETRSFNEILRTGNLNPFQHSAVVICSYQFARSKQPYLRQTPWDLVVIDEAHRLRNVYKASSRIASGAGWLTCSRITLQALEAEDRLLFAGATDAGEPLDEAQCRRLFDLPAVVGRPCPVPERVVETLGEALARRRRELLDDLTARNGRWFDLEMDKLDRWAEDRRASLKATLEDLDARVRDARRAARLAPNLPEKLERQRDLRQLETRRDEAWREFDKASREIDHQKDMLLDEIHERLGHTVGQEPLFTLRWTLS
jgi:hypothetical protein